MAKNNQATEDRVAQFEAALKELEQIVSRMEQADLRLEESLQLFERGVALAKQCREALETAELRVRQLTGAETGQDPKP